MEEGIACWYCGYGVDTEARRTRAGRDLPAHAALPIACEQEPLPDGADPATAPVLLYRTVGYFHDVPCLRAYLEADSRRDRYWRLFREYVRNVWDVEELPPPALPRALLQRFGGPLDWWDWKLRAAAGGDRWRLHDQAQEASSRIALRLAERARVETQPRRIKPPSEEVSYPGQTSTFDYLVDW